MSTAVDQFYSFAVDVPAGTAVSAPATTVLAVPAGLVEQIQVVIPPGPRGEVGFALAMSGQVIIPYGTATWVIADDEELNWDFQGLATTGAWSCVAYNTGSFDHTLQLRFTVGFGSQAAAGPPALITSFGGAPGGGFGELPPVEQPPLGTGTGLGPVTAPPPASPPPSTGGGPSLTQLADAVDFAANMLAAAQSQLAQAQAALKPLADQADMLGNEIAANQSIANGSVTVGGVTPKQAADAADFEGMQLAALQGQLSAAQATVNSAEATVTADQQALAAAQAALAAAQAGQGTGAGSEDVGGITGGSDTGEATPPGVGVNPITGTTGD